MFNTGMRAMALFKVHESHGRSTVAFSPNYPGVDISLDIRGLPSFQHDEGLVVFGPLASDGEIDDAVDKLIRELQEIRATAKQALKAYLEKAKPR
jgi:hypothetical protein